MLAFLKLNFKRLRASSFCRRDVPISSSRDVIGWWEARRIPFNLIVGSTGILSCIVVGVVILGSFFLLGGDIDLPDPPIFALFGIIAYGILANVCFTGGWLVELAIRRFWPQEPDGFATLSFYLGLLFSVLLTLTPAMIALNPVCRSTRPLSLGTESISKTASWPPEQ